jgi:hypothetical protein
MHILSSKVIKISTEKDKTPDIQRKHRSDSGQIKNLAQNNKHPHKKQDRADQ